MTSSGMIRAGVGGWTYQPWEGTFYPGDLPKSKQLHYASRQLSTIEVNGTFYRGQKPETFAKWAQTVPDGFVFSLKGHRAVTNRRVLGEAEESLARFFATGLNELGDRLGPLIWQFAPTKKFDSDDIEAFLKLLPEKNGGMALRHVLEPRHDSFLVPEFVALAAKHGVAICYAHHADYPEMADITADFVYARLQKGQDGIPTGYPPEELDRWAARAKTWAQGAGVDDLPRADASHTAQKRPRDVFVYFIHGGKVRAPAAAMAFMDKVTGNG